MNDLEERVRADLMLAAVDVEDRVDADEVLGAGRRLRRGRRITRAVGVAALVVVVAMGWTALRLPPPGLWPLGDRRAERRSHPDPEALDDVRPL
jgi:hypothetical protein